LRECEDEALDYKNPDSWRSHAERFNIPEGVHPLFDECPGMEMFKREEKRIRRWVKGEYSKDECALMYLEAMNVWEYDIAWVFMEDPSFYYSDRLIDLKQSCLRFCDIGSRNYKGNKARLTVSLESLERVAAEEKN
jgi:hypothetical protein